MDYLLQENCFLPHYKPLSEPSKELLQHRREEVEVIYDKQIIVSQLSEGGITYSDCNDMDLYEFEYVVRKLIKLKKEENEIRKKQIEDAKRNRG